MRLKTIAVAGALIASALAANSAQAGWIIGLVDGKSIVTIEGLDPKGEHPVQVAWRNLGVPQCGYCQAGQIMSAAALLKVKPAPTDKDIMDAMSGNLCRCQDYDKILTAMMCGAANMRKA